MTWLSSAEIKTAEDKAAEAKERARLAAKAERDNALANLSYTFEDGREIQTRLSDQALIMGGIEEGGGDWILKDNAVAAVTGAELKEALKAAKKSVRKAFKAYQKELKKL